jgi:hypothetical protein
VRNKLHDEVNEPNVAWDSHDVTKTPFAALTTQASGSCSINHSILRTKIALQTIVSMSHKNTESKNRLLDHSSLVCNTSKLTPP